MIIFKGSCFQVNLPEDLHWFRLPSSFFYHTSEALFQLRKLWLVLQTGSHIDRINSFLILNAFHDNHSRFYLPYYVSTKLEITSLLLRITILNCKDTFSYLRCMSSIPQNFHQDHQQRDNGRSTIRLHDWPTSNRNDAKVGTTIMKSFLFFLTTTLKGMDFH